MFVEKGIKPENLLISVRHILISEHRWITAECQKYGYKLLRALSYNRCIFLSRCYKTYDENDGELIEGIVGLSDNCFNYEKSVIADGVIEILISKEASYDFIDSLSEDPYPDTSYESQQSLQKLVIYGHSEYLSKYYNTIRAQLGIEAEFIDDYKSEVISGLDVQMNILNHTTCKDLLFLDSIISSVGIKKVNHDYEEVLFCNTTFPTKKIIELGENCSPVLKIVEKFRGNLIDLDEISDSGKSVSLAIEADLIINSKVE